MDIGVIKVERRFDSFGAESFYTVDATRGATGVKKKFHDIIVSWNRGFGGLLRSFEVRSMFGIISM